MTVKEDAYVIIQESIKAVLPQEAVFKALENKSFSSSVTVIAIGKAAWNMAFAVKEKLGDAVSRGIIITKYNHSKGPIKGFEIIEAGHPVPDENSVIGATKVLELVDSLDESDNVIFLVSGGGSAIFEKPMAGIELEDIIDITNQLLSSGADIVEINTIRKHLSDVKGGRFALHCKSKIFSIVLSDVLGDRLDSIASGPAYPDNSTSFEALNIILKYNLQVSEQVLDVLKKETPKEINNCETVITGSVIELCNAASRVAESLGYRPIVLTSLLDCEAREAGRFMAAIGKEVKRGRIGLEPPLAVIVGGETIVRIRGNGMGGRNQELCLSAAIGLEGLENAVIFSIGSDGTDGPTDAAGAIIDGKTAKRIRDTNIEPDVYLDNNDSYNALKASGDLVITGATGTNVNDLTVLLCK